jgi:hypothetical protein
MSYRLQESYNTGLSLAWRSQVFEIPSANGLDVLLLQSISKFEEPLAINKGITTIQGVSFGENLSFSMNKLADWTLAAMDIVLVVQSMRKHLLESKYARPERCLDFWKDCLSFPFNGIILRR